MRRRISFDYAAPLPKSFENQKYLKNEVFSLPRAVWLTWFPRPRFRWIRSWSPTRPWPRSRPRHWSRSWPRTRTWTRRWAPRSSSSSPRRRSGSRSWPAKNSNFFQFSPRSRQRLLSEIVPTSFCDLFYLKIRDSMQDCGLSQVCFLLSLFYYCWQRLTYNQQLTNIKSKSRQGFRFLWDAQSGHERLTMDIFFLLLRQILPHFSRFQLFSLLKFKRTNILSAIYALDCVHWADTIKKLHTSSINSIWFINIDDIRGFHRNKIYQIPALKQFSIYHNLHTVARNIEL